MEFTFEDKLNYIEQVLEIHLLDWQKKALQQVNEGTEELIWIPGKGSGRTVYSKAVKLLHQLNKSLENNEGWENDNLTYAKEYDMYFMK